MLPTALRIDGYRIFFYSNEGDEPPHVHVECQSSNAKFWLQPVCLVKNWGFNNREINKVEAMVEENQEFLIGKWNEYFRN